MKKLFSTVWIDANLLLVILIIYKVKVGILLLVMAIFQMHCMIQLFSNLELEIEQLLEFQV